ncbi:MAG: hypothetical protein KDN05_06590 [Verrucomicrobiae bacterium]|nr:hypothetical protein [Verrucomicrobiae bacterium]
MTLRPVSRPHPRFLIALVFLLPACQLSFDPRPLESADKWHATEDVATTPEQARLRMRSLVDPLTGEIETAADRILAATDDPAIRRAALEWKAQAVPGLREALFQPRPVVALFDSWAFAFQMRDFYSNGAGAKALGPQRNVAVATADRLERRINEVAASFTKSGDVRESRAAVLVWARNHPVEGSLAHRQTALALATELDLGLQLGGAEAVGTVAVTADDLNRKVEVYTDQLVRQARWEAELLAMDLTDQWNIDDVAVLGERTVGAVEGMDHLFDDIGSSVERLLPMLERITTALEGAPLLVSNERRATVEALHAELDRTISVVREERATALRFISNEREEALQTLQATVVQEREILTRDIEAISLRAIDHAFWRLAQLVLAVGAALLVLGIVALWIIRRMIPGLVRDWRAAAATGS